MCHQWDHRIAQLRRMRDWVIEAEHILDGSWAESEAEITNAQVGQRLDAWLEKLHTLQRSSERLIP